MNRNLLALAHLDAEQRRKLGAIATATNHELVVHEDVEAALEWLEHHNPRVIVVDTALTRAEKLVHKARSKKLLVGVPIVALAEDESDVFVAKLYGMGVDDVVLPRIGAGLMARLRALPEDTLKRPAADRGKAVVAHPDRDRWDVLGRVLMNAGYDARLAVDKQVLTFYASQSDVKLVIANSEVGGIRDAIDKARAAGNEAVWIVTAPKRDLLTQQQEVEGLERVAVIGAHLPPENVLFVSNELGSPQGLSARKSPRLLYGTMVAFRGVGSDEDEVGFTYNVSAGGLYVRTLAPPEAERVWLELIPPQGKHRVRLEGRVAWKRVYGAASGASVPPGFGVEITDGLGEGLTAWQSGCERLLEAPPPSIAGVRVPAPEPGTKAAKPLSRKPEEPLNELDSGWPGDVVPLSSRAPPKPRRIPTPAGTPTPPRPAGSVGPPRPGAKSPAPPKAGAKSPPPLPTQEKSSTPPPLPEDEPPPDIESTPASESDSRVVLMAALEEEELKIKRAAKAEREALRAERAAESKRTSTDSQDSQPESARREETRSSGKRPLPITLGLIVSVLVVGVVIAVFLRDRGRNPAPAPPKSSAALAPASASAPTAAASSTRSVTSQRDAAAADAATEGAAAEKAGAESGPDGSDLLSYQGYLIVKSSADAGVYLNGVLAGRTNQRLTVRCGPKFARLGKAPLPTWLSEGKSVQIKCQSVTEVTITPN